MTNVELAKLAHHIPNFRGVFMRDNLPSKIHRIHECGIVNLDNNRGLGTHWVAYIKHDRNVKYFDSFGNLRPPKELMEYFGKDVNITYNYERMQSYDDTNCGELCLKFLRENQSFVR